MFDIEGHIHLLDFGLCKYQQPEPAGVEGLERHHTCIYIYMYIIAVTQLVRTEPLAEAFL